MKALTQAYNTQYEPIIPNMSLYTVEYELITPDASQYCMPHASPNASQWNNNI